MPGIVVSPNSQPLATPSSALTRIVDQHVESVALLQKRFCRVSHGFKRIEVQFNDLQAPLAAASLQDILPGSCTLLEISSGKVHVRPSSVQGPRRLDADARRGSGHESDLAGPLAQSPVVFDDLQSSRASVARARGLRVQVRIGVKRVRHGDNVIFGVLENFDE